MKRPYSQFHTFLKPLLKESNVPLSHYRDAMDWYKFRDEVTSQEGPLDEVTMLSIQAAEALRMDAEAKVLSGAAVHLFMTGDLPFLDWLVSCVKDSFSLDSIQAFQEAIGDEKAIVVHFPTSFKIPSFAFGITDTGRPRIYAMSSREGRWTFWTALENLECNINDSKSYGDPQGMMDGRRYLKMAVAITLYCEAFPEVVKDGLPDDLEHPSHHRYQDVTTVNVSPKISTGTHASPCSHYRIGHFRCLRSDHFTAKRFKTIFVQGTFVKGHAKTVLSP